MSTASVLNWIKSQRRDRVINRCFGQTHPTHVRVLESEHDLTIDPHDGRVRKILLYDTARGRRKTNQVFWLDAAAAFAPTIALDIGLNYGECLFAPRYPAGTKLHGFEANPGLMRYVDQTREYHPNASDIRLHQAAVSDVSGQTVHLAVNNQWSGSSHLANADDGETVAVQSIRIDDAIDRPSAADRLLFKVDVEGFEPPVLRGMTETLAAAGASLGFVEFSPSLMTERGHDVAAYWEQLCESFAVFLCTHTGDAQPLPKQRWSDLAATHTFAHADLILVGGDAAASDAFLTTWTARASQQDA